MKKSGSRILVYGVIFLMFGFLISYSYQLTKEHAVDENGFEKVWTQEYKYKKKIDTITEQNEELQQELQRVQKDVRAIEGKLSEAEEHLKNLVETMNHYRMYLGKIPVQGRGIELTLSDATYTPEDGLVNNYLVHEQHLYQVINELYVSGAMAISINGQRLTKTSYIKCIGPVISVDGYEHPAPFVIQAIGNPDTLEKSLQLPSGVLDQLKYDHVEVQLKKMDKVQMDSVIQGSQ